MVLLAGVQGNALASLAAIDQWIGSLNASVTGSAKTGYKANKVTFGGGTTRTDLLPKNGALGIQYAEQALNVGSTNIDFSEGQVVASTEYTHLALNGSQNAFFLLTDDATVAAVGTPLAAGATRFYAREGEFHLDKDGYVRSKDGLFLVGQNSTPANAKIRIDLTTDPDPEATMAKMLENHNLNQNAAGVGTDIYTITHSYIPDLSNLQFSKYGSQVYQFNNFPTALPPGAVDERANPATSGGKVRISGNSLEASNVQLPSTLVELSLAQKIYSALTKVIQVDQQKLDGVLGLIR